MPFGVGFFAAAGAGVAAASYELISTQVLANNAASVTFSNLGTLAANYKHLQLRMSVRSAGTSNARILMQFNSDTGSNYASHFLYGTGSGAGSDANTSQSGSVNYFVPAANATASVFGSAIYDILEFSNTSKNKTVRVLSGSGPSLSTIYPIALHGFLWMNTNAITSILCSGDGQNIVADSRFSLYGIRA